MAGAHTQQGLGDICAAVPNSISTSSSLAWYSIADPIDRLSTVRCRSEVAVALWQKGNALQALSEI